MNARMTKKVNVGLTSLNTMGATPFFLAARTADAELMRDAGGAGRRSAARRTPITARR